MLVLVGYSPLLHAKDVTLSWDPSPTKAVVGYKVFVSMDPNMSPMLLNLDVGNVLTKSIGNLGDTDEHFFCVKAYDQIYAQDNDRIKHISSCSNIVHSPKIPVAVLPKLDFEVDVEIIKEH